MHTQKQGFNFFLGALALSLASYGRGAFILTITYVIPTPERNESPIFSVSVDSENSVVSVGVGSESLVSVVDTELSDWIVD